MVRVRRRDLAVVVIAPEPIVAPTVDLSAIEARLGAMEAKQDAVIAAIGLLMNRKPAGPVILEAPIRPQAAPNYKFQVQRDMNNRIVSVDAVAQKMN